MTVGLSMIIKNEPIDRLAMLVDYLRPIVSEFVFVDTGSDDYDLDAPLYQSWGVKVVPFTWVNDFSVARNETLKHLTTDWVLHLDADELPSYNMMRHIEQVTGPDAAPDIFGWRYFTINYWGGERGISVPEHWHVRLFKREYGAWYKPLHEQVAIRGLPEHQTVGMIVLNAPEHSYLIHSKPREQLAVSEALYKSMGG